MALKNQLPEDAVQIIFRCSESVRTRLRILAATQRKTLQDLLLEVSMQLLSGALQQKTALMTSPADLPEDVVRVGFRGSRSVRTGLKTLADSCGTTLQDLLLGVSMQLLAEDSREAA
jgi:hypothetical protein